MKNRNYASPKAINLLIGVAVSVIIFMALTLIFTVICYNTGNPTGNLGIFALVSLIVSGAIGGFSLSRAKSRFGFGNAVISALITASIFLIVSLISNVGFSASQFMNCGCYVMTSLLFAFLGKGGGKRKRHRRA